MAGAQMQHTNTDLTNKRTTRKTKTKTMTNTFREHLQRATFEIFDLWDMWSEWWENMTMTNKIRKTNTKTMMMTKAFREHHQRGIFEDFRKYPQMAISEKFWVWLLIHCFEFRPFQTKLIWVWPNFTISIKFHNFGQISKSWNTLNTWNTWS